MTAPFNCKYCGKLWIGQRNGNHLCPNSNCTHEGGVRVLNRSDLAVLEHEKNALAAINPSTEGAQKLLAELRIFLASISEFRFG